MAEVRAGAGTRGSVMRNTFLAFALLAVVIWIGIAIGANARAPGVIGLAATVFGGLFAATLTVAIGGFLALKLAASQDAQDDVRPGATMTFPELAPALAELESRQRPVTRTAIERAAWRTPLGAALAVAAWSVLVLLGAPGGFLDFSGALLGGGLLAWGWTRMDASRDYARIHSQHVMDALVGGMGGLSWRAEASVDTARIRDAGVLPAFSDIRTAGEISGTVSGVSLSIASIQTTPPAGADKSARYTGLVVLIDAPHLGGASMEDLAAARPSAVALIGQLSTLPQLGKPTSSMAPGQLTIAVQEAAPRLFDPPTQPGSTAAAPRLARVRQVVEAARQIASALSANV